jgi:hypothetical protein
MNDKERALADLRAIYEQWKALVARLREPELTEPLPGGLSVKDVLAHLRAWQQLSIARLEAAHFGREPVMPGWPVGPDPDEESQLDENNARIYATYRDQTWSEVYRAWRDGFLRLLALAEVLPEADLLDWAKYPWLHGHAPLDVLRGTYEHHREHLEDLV